MGWDLLVDIATSYGAGRSGDRIPVGTRFSTPVQTDPGPHPASHKMDTGSFPGVKRAGRGVDHQPPSSTEVKERVELYLYSPSRPSLPVLGWTSSSFIKIWYASTNFSNILQCKISRGSRLFSAYRFVSTTSATYRRLHLERGVGNIRFALTFWSRNYFFNFTTLCI